MELRKGYKQTEIGVIPDDWDVEKMGDIGQSIIGLTYTPSAVKEYGTLVLRSSNIQNNKLAFKDNVFVDMNIPQRVITKENDILICVRNGSKRLIGKAARIDSKTAGSAFGAFMSVYRSDNGKFMFYQFQSFAIQKQINEVLGATINQITNKDLNNFIVAIPPKPEQKAIAKALSDVDALIESLEQLIAKKRHIKQGAMQELLSPKEGWITEKLGNLCGIITTGELDANAMVENGDYPFFTCAKESYKIDKVAFDLEALLVSGNGANVGYIHYYKGKFNAYQRTYVLSQFRCDVKYLKVFMEHYLQARIKVEVNAGGTPYIVRGTLTDMNILLPENKKEQKAIATILSDMDSEIEALETKLEKTKQIKEGMMHELLTGRIRLV